MTPEYRQNFIKGAEYQDFIMERLYEQGIVLASYSSKKYQVKYGENKAGIEIKFDGRMKETGNVYFEISEKSDPHNLEFIASGIFRNDNTWLYVIGDYEVAYVCGESHLRLIYERETGKKKTSAEIKETPTSKGMILPQKYVEERLALKTLRFERR